MSYDTYDCEPYSVYQKTRRRARKAHKCGACHETIRPGDSYMVVSIVFDGTAETIKRCARCEAIHDHLVGLCLADGERWPEERLNCGESYEDEWGECPEEIQALAFALPGEDIGVGA